MEGDPKVRALDTWLRGWNGPWVFVPCSGLLRWNGWQGGRGLGREWESDMEVHMLPASSQGPMRSSREHRGEVPGPRPTVWKKARRAGTVCLPSHPLPQHLTSLLQSSAVEGAEMGRMGGGLKVKEGLKGVVIRPIVC